MQSRGAVRAALVCQVECTELASGTRLPNARVSDVSTSGIFVESMVAFPSGSRVLLAFDVCGVPVRVTAEVVNPMPSMGMGMRFLDLEAEPRRAIESLTG